MNNNDVIKELSKYVLETENLANDFLPLKDKLNNIKEDLNKTLDSLEEKVNSSDDLSDKFFYTNRYVDLLKKVDSIFDNRSRRIQYAISTLIKAQAVEDNNSLGSNNKDDTITPDDTNINLSPEDAMAIVQILNKQ